MHTKTKQLSFALGTLLLTATLVFFWVFMFQDDTDSTTARLSDKPADVGAALPVAVEPSQSPTRQRRESDSASRAIEIRESMEERRIRNQEESEIKKRKALEQFDRSRVAIARSNPWGEHKETTDYHYQRRTTNGIDGTSKVLHSPPQDIEARDLVVKTTLGERYSSGRIEYRDERVYLGFDHGAEQPVAPPGYADRLSLTIRFQAKDLRSLPDSVYVEEIGGGDIYQIPLVTSSPPKPAAKSSEDSSAPKIVVDLGVLQKTSTQHKSVYSEFMIEVLLPWPKVDADYFLFGDIGERRSLAVMAQGARSATLVLNSDVESEELEANVFLPGGSPASGAYILDGWQVVGKSDERGRAAVQIPSKSEDVVRTNAYLSAFLPGYFVTSQLVMLSAKRAPLEFRLPSAVRFQRVRLPVELNFVELSQTSAAMPFPTVSRYGKAWPAWASEDLEHYRIATNSMMFRPAIDTVDKNCLPFIDLDRPAFSGWLTAAPKALELSMVARNGQEVIDQVVRSFLKGRGPDGHFRLRLPTVTGEYLFLLTASSEKPLKHPKSMVLRVRVSDATSPNPSPVEFELVDLARDYLTFDGSVWESSSQWLRYTFGDKGAHANPPMVPDFPVPVLWPRRD